MLATSSLFPGPQNLIGDYFAFPILLRLGYTVLLVLIKSLIGIVHVIIPRGRNYLRVVTSHTRGW